MAEERLIDDDKDKKYRFRINENGEEELVIDEGAEEEQTPPATEAELELPQEAFPEEEDLMTEEQLAAKRELEEKERAERARRVEELLSSARADVSRGGYATALEYLERAEEIDEENGEIYALRMTAYTRSFTDYSLINKAAESAEGVASYTSRERKDEMLLKSKTALEDNIAQLRKTVAALDKENEEKKAERAVKFVKDRNVALAVLFAVLVALGAFVGCAAYFALIIYTVQTGLYLVLTIVFGALAFVAFIALAFAARRLNITARRVRLNNRNTSTELGRTMLLKQEELRSFLAVYNALKD